MSSKPVTTRIVVAFLLLAAVFAAPGWSATSEFRILVNRDLNLSSGCDLTPTPPGPPGPPATRGLEQILTATVTTGPGTATVTSITNRACTNGATDTFGPATPIAGATGGVGQNNGVDGFDVVEICVPYATVSAGPPPQARIGLISSNLSGSEDQVFTPDGDGNQPILLGLQYTPPIPTLSEWGLILMALLLAAAAAVRLRKRPQVAGGLMLLVILGMAGVAWAVVTDGLTNDWQAGDRLATDPIGDALLGADVRALFGKVENNQICFRIDASLDIPPPNQPPVADNDAYSVDEGGTLTVPAPGVLDGDTDPESDPLTAVLVTGPAHASSFTLNADGSFTYVHDGSETPTTDTFTYQANDGGQNSNVATVTITINPLNDAPVADNDAYSVAEGGTLTVPAPGVLDGDNDPEGSPLTAVLVTGPAHASSFTLNTDGSFTYTHNGTETPTTDTFTYQANDGTANSNVATVTLTILGENDAPTADDDAYSVAEGGTLTQPAPGVLDGDSDPEGDPLTAVLVTGPAHASSFTLNADGSFTYVHDGSETPGTDSFTYQASDGSLTSNVATVTITITSVNDPPVADDDAYSVAEGGTLTELAPGVLDGDTDAESDPLTAVLVTGPAHASSFTLNADGSFTYVHDGGEATTDSFTYQANDGTSNSNVATVTITITGVNDAPVADDDAYSVAEGGTLTQPAPGVLDGDTDAEGDPLTAVLVTGPAHASSFTLNADGSFTYVHDGSETPSIDTFTYQANDGTASSNIATVTITITAVNDAPVADDDAYSVNEGETLTEPAPGVLVGDVDPDGDPLAAVLVTGPAHASSFTLNADGSFTYVHNGSETPSTDTFTYRANDGTANSNVATVTITINPVNDGPVLDLDADDSGGTPGSDYAVAFTDGDPARLIEDPADATITDADSATLTTLTVTLTNLLDAGDEILDVDLTGADPAFTKDYDTTTDPTQGVLTITASPARPVAEFVTLLRTVTYVNTSNNPDTTTRSIQFVANDGTSDSNIAATTVTITSVNDAPVADNDAYSVAEGGTLTEPAPGVLDGDTDPDGDPLTAVLDSGPAHASSFTLNADGSFTYVHDGGETTADSFTYHANDGTANSNVATVTITITGVNDAPVADNDAYAVDEGGTLTQPAPGVLGNDNDPEGTTLTAVLDSGPANSSSFTLNADGSFTYVHNGSETTTDSFTYHANDGTANSNVATVTITITPVNDAPVADNDAYAVDEGGTLTQPAPGVLDGDTDAEGDPLTAVLDSGPAHASSFTLNADGSFTYVHNGSETLTDSFTYHANDGSANSNVATVTITINPVDDPPTAVADAATVDEDSGANAINVLANDTDPDAGPISITSVTQPANGTVVITGGGTGLTYAPNLNYCNLPPGTAPDTFTYTLTPGGSSAVVSVLVNCINDPPVAGNDTFDFIGNTELRVDLAAVATPHALETTGSGFGLLDNDSDPVENDPISLIQLVVGACVDNSAPFSCTDPAIGTVNLDANGRFSFIPAPGDTGTTETFSYTISDGQPVNSTATGTVTLNRVERVWYVKNDAPAGGLGRSNDPFDTLIEAQTASLANDYIFVYFGSGTTTGHTAGIALKNGQHLIGEHAGLSLPVNLNGNGSPTNLVAAAAGNRPMIDDTVVDAIEGVSAVNVIPAEIVGLNLAGNVNAIDWSTNAAFAGTGAFSIRDNVIRSAGGDGVDINLAGTGNTSLAFHDNVLTATGAGLDIQETGTGTLTITRFDDNVVSGNTAGTGININNAVFDATPGGVIDAVGGGVTVIGAAGNGVGGSGLVIAGMTGTLAFSDLDIFADGGSGLRVGGTGVANTTVSVSPGVGTIQSSGGPAVDLASLTTDLQLTSLTVAGSPTTGVSLDTVNGTFSAGSGSTITNATGTDFNVNAGTANVSYAGTITNTAGRSVNVTNRTGTNAVTFSGAINDTGTGIFINGNSANTTTHFTGGLTMSTGANNAFTATSGGILRVTGSTNTIATTTGTALNVSNTTIHADDLTFRSISSNGGSNTGIILSSTGSNGNLIVTGTGGAGTGGTIANKSGTDGDTATGIGIYLNNTQAPSFSHMQLNNFGNFAIRGTNVVGFTLNNTTINGANGSSAALDEGSVSFNGLTGSASIATSSISGGFEDNLRIVNTTGTLNRLMVSGTTIGHNSTTNGNNGVLLEATGAGTVLNATITGSTFTGARADWVNAASQVGASMDFIFSNNTLTNSHPTTGSGGARTVLAGTGALTYQVSGNTYQGSSGAPVFANAANSTAVLSGRIENNIIGVAGTANSGSSAASGIQVEANGGGDHTVLINNNQIRQYNNHGILLLAGDTMGNPVTFNATVTNNTISNPGSINTNFNGIHLNNGTTAIDNFTSCIDIRSNNISGSGSGAVAPNNADFRLRQRQSTSVRLPGYAGANNNDAAVVSFVSGNNTVSTGAASNTVPPGGGFIGGAACPQP